MELSVPLIPGVTAAPATETQLGPADDTAYADVARAMRAGRDHNEATATAAAPSLAATAMDSSTATQEQAAQALETSKVNGTSPERALSSILNNTEPITSPFELNRDDTVRAAHEALAAYMLRSPAHVALVKPDVPVLSMLKEGLERGVIDIRAALEANRSAKQKFGPEDESELASMEHFTASPIPGATGVPRRVGAEIARATPTLALFGAAASGGALVGGAIGGAPTLGVGAAPGAAAGAIIATAGLAFTLGFGPLYRRLKQLVNEQGDPLLTDDQAKSWATGGAAVSAGIQVTVGAPFLKSLPGVRGTMEKVGLDATTRVVQTTVGRAAVQRLAQMGGHTLSGAMAMAAQSATNAATIELSKQQNGATPDWDQVTHAAAEGFKTGLLLAPLSVIEPGRGFFHDVGRIRDARLEVARLDQLTRAAKELGIVKVAPDEAERVIGQLAAGSDGRTVFVNPESIPEVARQRLGEVLGPEPMAEAAATKGDVAVPIETYLTRIAPDFHDQIRDHVKLSPDGYTLKEAAEQEAHHASAVKDIEKFQLAHVGTGTGLASEGYGLYASSTGEIARLYLEAHAERTGHGDVGRIYKIGVPSDDVLLHFRKTLSEQPERIRTILEGAGLLGDGTQTGRELYKALKERWLANDPELVATNSERPDQAASRYLDSLGIPGATYPAELAPGGKPAKNFLIWRESAFRMNEPVSTPKPTSAAALGAQARQLVETKRLGDLAPGRRQLAASNASRRLAAIAAETTLKNVEGTPQTPGRALNRLQEIAELEQARDTNQALAKAETELQKEAEGHRKFLLDYTKDDARAELGKAGDDYVAQVDRLLSGFELGQNATRSEVGRRLATMEWIAKEQDAGREPIIPESVLSKLDRFVHWKDLTAPELRDLRSAVESIAHQAEFKNTLLERNVRSDRNAAIAELINGLRANTDLKTFKPAGSTVGNLERLAEKLSSLKYGARAVERIINDLDGGNINGPWHRYIWDPINDSTHAWHDLVRRTTQEVVKAVDEMPREDLKRWRETRFEVNGTEYDLSAAVAVALNWGNDSNRSKLLKGWQDQSVSRRGLMPWNSDTPEQFLGKLTAKDWEFVQKVWDRLESMWPEAAALEKRLTGLAPERVEPRAFTRTLEDGSTVDLRGGYYPVIYDSDFSKAGLAGEEASSNRSVQLFDRDYYRAATPQGHLQKRIEGFARPILLSLDALPHKVSEAAKDTTMREALLSVHSALTDDRVRAALQTSELGRAGEKALLGWLRDTANDLAVPDNGAGTWFNVQSRTRAGYTASIFAYNLGQTAQNLTAVAPAVRAVGPVWMTESMVRLAKEQGSLIEWMNAQSGELRNHERGGQAVADAVKMLAEKPGAISDFMQFGMKFFQSTDIAVKYPTWLAAYMKGVAEKADGGLGFDHKTAVRHADATIRLNVMAGNTKDLPALLRNKLGRFMLPLYSYNLHRLNMVADAIGLVKGAFRERAIGKAAGIVAGAWGAFAAEAVLSELVKGNGPGDENNDGTVDATDTAIWTAKISALSPLFWIPVLGQAVKSAATGKPPMGTPEASAMGDIGGAVHKTGKLAFDALSDDSSIDEEQVKGVALQLLKVGGDLGGVPAQLRTTLGYALDPNSPKDDPFQIGLGVAFGKKRPGKLLNLTE